jgi:hypothetical protein
MATLYDLELQESNNFIHLFLMDGVSPSLRLMRDQKEMAPSLGDAGTAIIAMLDDPKTDIGRSFARLGALEGDVLTVMKSTGMTKDLAERAQAIFQRNPEGLDKLSDVERSSIQDYWIKKKMCITELLNKGYTQQELYS